MMKAHVVAGHGLSVWLIGVTPTILNLLRYNLRRCLHNLFSTVPFVFRAIAVLRRLIAGCTRTQYSLQNIRVV